MEQDDRLNNQLQDKPTVILLRKEKTPRLEGLVINKGEGRQMSVSDESTIL